MTRIRVLGLLLIADVAAGAKSGGLCAPSTLQGGRAMPEKRTIEKARADKHAGKAPSTQAGEFVHEEIEHIRTGKHGARSAKQAIAIGLSKARRAGVKLPAQKRGSAQTQNQTAC